jgi:hypothetical protein
MRKMVPFTVIPFLLVAMCSCETMPTKQARGNFELTVEPVFEGETPLYPTVYVDRKFIGHATSYKPILYLRRGRHTIRVELDGYEPWEETITILGDPNQQVLHVKLRRSSTE